MNIRPSNYRRWLYATAVRVHDQEFWIRYGSNGAVSVGLEKKALNNMCKIPSQCWILSLFLFIPGSNCWL